MKKDILIAGPARTGKSTLAQKICKEFGYNLLGLDDLVSGFEFAYPELGIVRAGDNRPSASKFTKFLCGVFNEASIRVNHQKNIFYVAEGVFINFDELFTYINKEDFIIIGFHFSELSEKDIFNNVRKYDTPFEWSYHEDDEALIDDCTYFKYMSGEFLKQYQKFGIKNYDVSYDREKVFDLIIEELKTLLIK